MRLFLNNADHGRNAANDELVAALRQRAREIQEVERSTAGDDPELTAAMQRAEGYGFRFWKPRPDAAWWGERETAQWIDFVFLDPLRAQ